MIFESMTPMLNVEDVELSLEFYHNTLGFEVEERYFENDTPIWAQLSHGDIMLMLNRPKQPDSEARRARPSFSGALFYFKIPDLHAAHQELVERGYEPGRIERTEYGFDEFMVRDPDGYELAFGRKATR